MPYTGGLSYHTYPSPNSDANGPWVPATYIFNNSYVYGFPAWLRSDVTPPSADVPPARRSIISEFGWNPGQMARCKTPQSTVWPTRQDGAQVGTLERGKDCGAMDGQIHPFSSDAKYFVQYQRYGAEVVAVWQVNGREKADDGSSVPSMASGISDNQLLAWLVDYRNAVYP